MLILGAWYVTLFAILFVTVCLFMMLVILIQKPRGGGLSGAFGGGGGGAQAAFGAKTGDVLTWFTVICFGAFLILAIGLTWSIKPSIQPPTPALEAAADADDTGSGAATSGQDTAAPNAADGPDASATPPVIPAGDVGTTTTEGGN